MNNIGNRIEGCVLKAQNQKIKKKNNKTEWGRIRKRMQGSGGYCLQNNQRNW